MANDWGNLKGEVLDPSKCKARVSDHDSRWPHYYQCSAAAKRDGYCNRHHPDTIKTKINKADAAYKAQNDYVDWLYKERAARMTIADAVIEDADSATVKRLVEEYRTLKAAKPPVVSIPAWRRP